MFLVACDGLVSLAGIINSYYHLVDGTNDQLNANMTATGRDYFNSAIGIFFTASSIYHLIYIVYKISLI